MSQTTPVSMESIDAPHPFNQPSADLILRTADLVDFHVHSQILAQASPFFATMRTLPQPTAASFTTPNGATRLERTPVVPVSEDSAALELLLRIVYPVSEPLAKTVDPQALASALLAATKYEMELPVEIMTAKLAALTTELPLQVWSVACRVGLEDVALLAAEVLKASGTHKADTEALVLMDSLGDMTGISAGDYYRLKRFLAGKLVLNLLSPLGNELGDTPILPARSLFSTDIPDANIKCQPSSRHGATTSFLAHQSVLCSQSSVLKARILNLRNIASITSPLPSMEPLMLELDDNPEVISMLLTACYDNEDTLPTALPRIADLLTASEKYGMTRVVRRVHRAWNEAAAVRPLEAYFVALDHDLEECAKAAAKHVLAGPVADAYVNIMDRAPALQYHRLLVYYDACRHVARERLDQAYAQVPDRVWVSCDDCDDDADVPTKDIKTRLRHATHTEPHSPRGDLRTTLRDAVIQAGTGRGQLSSFAASLIKCVVSVPDEIDRALNDVRHCSLVHYQTESDLRVPPEKIIL